MWYDSIHLKEIGYHLTKDGYDIFVDAKGNVITKQYWDGEEILNHTYHGEWFQHLYPPVIDIFDDDDEIIDKTCTFQFTTNGILYGLGEYNVYGDYDVECKSFEYIFVDYENE